MPFRPLTISNDQGGGGTTTTGFRPLSATGTTTTTDQNTQLPNNTKQDLGAKVGADFVQRGRNAASIFSDQSQGNAVTRGIKAAGQAFGGVTDVIGEGLKSAAGLLPKALTNMFFNSAEMDKVSKERQANGAVGPVDALASTNLFKGAAESGQTKGLENTLGAVSAAGDIAGTIAGAEVTPEAGGASTLKETANDIKTTTSDLFKSKADVAKEVDNLAGTIVQGKTADVAKAKSALSSIDPTGVKTYKDLSGKLTEKINNLTAKLDETLETNTDTKKLSDLTLKSKVGDQTVEHNYVQDSIDQLKAHYTATNDVKALAKINQLEAKATTEGLTVKEINDLAKEHGQAINAFNANGQAASGLAKQAAENTRTGLKSTARDLFGNPVYKAADKEVSNLIRTRDLVDNVSEAVNKLQQKIKTRSLGEKLGRLAGKVIDTVGLGSPKGLVEYFLSRGTGLKTLNALDLEESLSKNLTSLQKALKPGASATDIEKSMQEIIDQSRSTQRPMDGNTRPSATSTSATPDNTQQNIKKSNIPNSVPQTKPKTTAGLFSPNTEAKVKSLMSKATENKPIIDKVAKQVADTHDATFVEGPLKKSDRIIEKVNRDHQGDFKNIETHIKDGARNTIVAPTGSHSEIISSLKKEFPNAIHKVQSPDVYNGYEGNILSIPMKNGVRAEIQVHTPEMLVAKFTPKMAEESLGKELFNDIVKKSGVEPGKGHILYEKEQKAIIDGDNAARNKYAKMQQEYYSHFK